MPSRRSAHPSFLHRMVVADLSPLRMREPVIVFATGRGPRDPTVWQKRGSREGYGALREREARDALGVAGVNDLQYLTADGAGRRVIDQELFRVACGLHDPAGDRPRHAAASHSGACVRGRPSRSRLVRRAGLSLVTGAWPAGLGVSAVPPLGRRRLRPAAVSAARWS